MHKKLLSLLLAWAECFNFETRWPIVKEGPVGSHFGYAVDGYQYNGESRSTVIVGAPTESGAVVSHISREIPKLSRNLQSLIK